MSAFLGPVHYWLFNKIKFENDFTEEVLALAKEKSYALDTLSGLDEACGKLEEGNLEDLIDGMNIHGWLQERVNIVEERLALLVTSILAEDESRREEILKLAFQYGKRYAYKGNSVEEAYELFNNLMLNGMPCDRVIVIEENTEDRMVLTQTTDIHEKYWTKYMGDVRNYQAIRKNIIAGIFEDSGVEFLPVQGKPSFELRKRV